MKTRRIAGFLLWLVFAFAAGQQAALLHGLSHAVQKEAPSPGAPCGECAAASQMGGLAGAAGLPDVAIFEGSTPAIPVPQATVRATRVAVFRSRAPPTFL